MRGTTFAPFFQVECRYNQTFVCESPLLSTVPGPNDIKLFFLFVKVPGKPSLMFENKARSILIVWDTVTGSTRVGSGLTAKIRLVHKLQIKNSLLVAAIVTD
jgi:hypothetical protein